jgi:hypothetical protein
LDARGRAEQAARRPERETAPRLAKTPITAVLPTGIEPSLGIAGLLFHKIGARLRRRPRRILS